nr:hypothetical protein CFP56_41604 [Quercus suber]
MEESSSSEFQRLQLRGLPRRNRRWNQCGRWGLGWVSKLDHRLFTCFISLCAKPCCLPIPSNPNQTH